MAEGACVGVCVWQGACMAGGCVWSEGSMRGGGIHGRRAYMAEGGCIAGGVHDRGGCAWQILRDTVNERAVRILLECISFFKIILIP